MLPYICVSSEESGEPACIPTRTRLVVTLHGFAESRRERRLCTPSRAGCSRVPVRRLR